MHECKHESQIAVVVDKVEKIEETVEKIFKILNGNGKNGLVTNVALNKSAIRSAEAPPKIERGIK